MPYLRNLLSGAVPKYISGRISYLRVRLAFHLYSQLISAICTSHEFGPPPRFIGASPWPRVAHTVSDLMNATIALFGLAFAAAPRLKTLNLATPINSLGHSSIGTLSGRLLGPLTGCKLVVSVLFHSPPGVLFTFPSRYWFTIGRQEYLALGGGPPGFPRDFTCPVVLKNVARAFPFCLQDCHLLWCYFPECFS